MTAAQRRKAEQDIRAAYSKAAIDAENAFARAVRDALADRDDRIVIAKRERDLKLRALQTEAVGV